jgi:hypothetical protein
VRIAWSTAQPERRCGRRYDIASRRAECAHARPPPKERV